MDGVSVDNKGIIVYVISANEKDLSSKLRSCNLVTIVLGEYSKLKIAKKMQMNITGFSLSLHFFFQLWLTQRVWSFLFIPDIIINEISGIKMDITKFRAQESWFIHIN